MAKKTSIVIGGCILAGLHLASVTEVIADSICTECISIRLGRPLSVRGPVPDEMDTPFNEIKLASGFYRGFSSNATSYAIDGMNPWDMGNVRQPVLSPGEAGSINSCGQWLNDTEQVTGGVHGFIHNEMSCNYALSQTQDR